MRHVPATQRNERRFTFMPADALEIPVLGSGQGFTFSETGDLVGFDDLGIKGRGVPPPAEREAARGLPPATPGIMTPVKRTRATDMREIISTPGQQVMRRKLEWVESPQKPQAYAAGVGALEALPTNIRFVVPYGDVLVMLQTWLESQTRVFRCNQAGTGIARVASLVQAAHALDKVYVDFDGQRYELMGFASISSAVWAKLEGQRVQLTTALGAGMWPALMRDEYATALLAAIVTLQMAGEAYVVRTSAYTTNQQSRAMRTDVTSKQAELLEYIRTKYGVGVQRDRRPRMLSGVLRY